MIIRHRSRLLQQMRQCYFLQGPLGTIGSRRLSSGEAQDFADHGQNVQNRAKQGHRDGPRQNQQASEFGLQRRQWTQNGGRAVRNEKDFQSRSPDHRMRRQNLPSRHQKSKDPTDSLMQMVFGSDMNDGAPKSAAALVQGLVPDAVNGDLLAVANYMIHPSDVARLHSGRMSTDEHKKLAMQIETLLLHSSDKMRRIAKTNLVFEANANNRLGDTLVAGSSPASPESALSAMKEEICSLLSLDTAAFEELKEVALKDFRDNTLPMLEAYNPTTQEQEFQALLDGLPKDHEKYSAARSMLETVRGNPHWAHGKKITFARRLIRHLM